MSPTSLQADPLRSPPTAAVTTTPQLSRAPEQVPEPKRSMGPPVHRVGVIGLGRMGEIYAANLIADGYQVMVHDRSEALMSRLTGAGASVAFELGDLTACQVVVTALPDDGALADVALRAGRWAVAGRIPRWRRTAKRRT